MVTDIKAIYLPNYAIEYLEQMCKTERKRLTYLVDQTGDITIQIMAAFDTLNIIESSI